MISHIHSVAWSLLNFVTCMQGTIYYTSFKRLINSMSEVVPKYLQNEAAKTGQTKTASRKPA